MKSSIIVIILSLCSPLLQAEDERPVVDATKVVDEKAARASCPTLHIVGDSTVRSGGHSGMWGWGERLAPWFDTQKINLVNHAIGGRSARTFFTEGRWKKVEDMIKAGDFVLIQFGHNDLGRIGDPANKGRADGPGVGDEVVEEVKADGSKEKVHTFGWYMSQMIAAAKQKRAQVVICSPVPHKQRWEKERDFPQIASWNQQLADTHRIEFMDLTQIVTEGYRGVGKEQVEQFFADKGTHTNDAGAQFNAGCVVRGVKMLKSQALASYLLEKQVASATSQVVRCYTFGEEKRTDAIHVSQDDGYRAEKGYGFDAITPTCQQFSIKLPEGAYQVIVDAAGTGPNAQVTIKSEQRRLMLENVSAEACKTRPFFVHTRTTRIDDRTRVGLKQREVQDETWLWDDRLTLEFFGVNARLRSITITQAHVPTLFIAGDSTVCDQPAEPWNSWGQMLPRFVSNNVVVANYAQSGESIKSSLGARRFEKIFRSMKKGDYLLLQFGHNDQKDKAADALAVYQKNLEMLVDRTRSLGATPILITSMERSGGVTKNTLGEYPTVVRRVAEAKHCDWIDLHAMSQTLYQALGPQLKMAFQDGTHHNNYGSYQLAQCVALGLKKIEPVSRHLSSDFAGFDPSKPDNPERFTMPLSPSVSEKKPLGN